jgi:N-acetylglucosamine-6-phosphate deacetylase
MTNNSNQPARFALRNALLVDGETVEIMHRTNLRSGTTGFLPALITTSEENMRLALEVVRQYRNDVDRGVLGVHLEGPYINPERKGIHNVEFISRPTKQTVEKIAAAAREFPVMLTLVTMIEAIAKCVRYAGIPLPEAVRMASLYPARVLKRDHELGQVKAGYLSDLTAFDDSFVVRGVVERGKWLPRDFPKKAPVV